MNRFENWFCASSLWRRVTEKQLLPWLLAGTALGEHALEIGAGAGAATEELRRRAARVTSLEFSENLATKLAARTKSMHSDSPAADANGQAGAANGAVLRGDATELPFPDKTFSAVIAVLMLHHLPSSHAQDRASRETFRVLRPGGVFLALEIESSWLNRIAHVRSTFVPYPPDECPARLSTAGFIEATTENRRGAFRIKASRPRGGC